MTSRIKYGLAIPQGWIGDLPSDISPTAQFEYARDLATKAESLNYDSIWLFDHLLPSSNVKDPEQVTFFECWTMLSAIAVATKKVKIGQLVTCNSYRSPSLLAKMGATLDAISGGRLILGIGTGWYQSEYAAYGYEFSPPSVRVRKLDESLEIITKMWTQSKATFQGKYYGIKDAICNPRPIQKPHPPILVGGSGEQLTLAVVAKHADIHNFNFGSPEEFEHKMSVLKQHCNKIGRDFNSIEKSYLCRLVLGKDKDHLNAKIERMRPPNLSSEDFVKQSSRIVFYGTPEEVIQRFQRFVDLGVTHIILHLGELEKNSPELDLLSKEVIPKIRV
ncbi:MAG: LLM class F420-dependent oxidoreductase [Thaumarchaeota archaeon]|nr:LLM class F420-dependent oxidoreductase [Nitrososphaerota archaeon]